MPDQAHYLVNRLKRLLRLEIIRFVDYHKDLRVSENIVLLVNKFHNKYKKNFEKEVRKLLKKEKITNSDTEYLVEESINLLQETLIDYKKEAFKDFIENNPQIPRVIQKKRFSIWKSGLLASVVSGNIYSNIAEKTAKNNNITHFIWKDSTSIRKREEHINNYGKIFSIEKGDNGVLPAQLYNCKCGMEYINV